MDASGVRRSWLTAREQRGPHPVAFGERLGLRGLGAQPGPVEGRDRLGGVPGEQRGGRAGRLPAHLKGQVGPDLEALSTLASWPAAPLDGDPDPAAADALEQLGVAAVAGGEVVEHVARACRRRRARSGPGRAGTAVSFALRAASASRRAARWTTLLTATATVTNSTSASRFLGSAIVKRVQRRGEVPVQQQAGGDGGEHRGPEAADDRDRDHRDEVDQQVVGEVQVPRARRRAARSAAGSPATASAAPASCLRRSMPLSLLPVHAF